MQKTNNLIVYQENNGQIKLEVGIDKQTVWLNEVQIAELFGIDRSGVSKHIKHLFSDGEVPEESNVQKMHIANSDKPVKYYSLDIILAVGYRANSPVAIRFRQWATQTLKEYIVKGFAMDDERLKNPAGLDYFDELLERIREIRASEKRFYQKVRDLFSLSDDYGDNREKTNNFFASAQNKLLYAITKQTAAEIIKLRSNAGKPNMNLFTWEGSRVRKTDVIIAKNYLTENEIKKLDRLVVAFLDYAEIQIEQNPQKATTSYWATQIDRFIEFNNYPTLKSLGSISHKTAEKIVFAKYELFEAARRKREAIEADKADMNELKQLEQISKKKKR
jgi:hypothetical protein